MGTSEMEIMYPRIVTENKMHLIKKLWFIYESFSAKDFVFVIH